MRSANAPSAVASPTASSRRSTSRPPCGRGAWPDAVYAGSPVSAQLKVSGIDVFSAGEVEPADGAALVLRDPAAGVYRRLNVTDGRLTGAVLVGDVTDGAWFKQLIDDRTDVAAARRALAFGRAFAEPLLAAGNTVSSCEDCVMDKTRVLVIGNGMVGQHLVDVLAETAADRFALTVCGEETRPAYDRVHLSEYFGDKSADDLSLTTPAFYAEPAEVARVILNAATPGSTCPRPLRNSPSPQRAAGASSVRCR